LVNFLGLRSLIKYLPENRLIFMFRKLYVMIGACLLATAAFGQQDPQFSFFPFAPTLFNPATVGSEGVTRVQFIHRTQWAGYLTSGGVGGAPSTQLLTANLPLTSLNSGIGFYAFNDQAGPTSNQSFQLAYAYRLPLKSGTLSVGLQGGLYNKRIDFSGAIFNDDGDELIPAGAYSQMQPDISAGIHYNTVDYWLGVSLYHINQPSYRLGAERGINPLERTAFVSAGYRLGLTYELDLQPSILYKYAPNSGTLYSSLDVNLLATYSGRYYVGASYRHQESVTGMAAINMLPGNALRLGFAYDFVTFGTGAKNPSSYELMVSYALPAPNTNKKPIIRTPRFRY
jgi:type IX secretion system PorP/SprF family membrane protein